MHPTVTAMLAEERQAELRRTVTSRHRAVLAHPASTHVGIRGDRPARVRRQLASLLSPDLGSAPAACPPTGAQACCA